MKTARKKILDYQLEWIKDFIGKKVAGIVLAPPTFLQPEEYRVITHEFSMSIFDAVEWGYLNMKAGVLILDGISSMDLDYYQGFCFTLYRNNNPLDKQHEKIFLPTYGTLFEYSNFVINKIEIYGINFQLDKYWNNIFKIEEAEGYNKENVVVETDSVIIFYGEGQKCIVISAEMRELIIGFGDDYKQSIITRPNFGYTTPENPIFLELNHIIS